MLAVGELQIASTNHRHDLHKLLPVPTLIFRDQGASIKANKGRFTHVEIHADSDLAELMHSMLKELIGEPFTEVLVTGAGRVGCAAVRRSIPPVYTAALIGIHCESIRCEAAIRYRPQSSIHDCRRRPLARDTR